MKIYRQAHFSDRLDIDRIVYMAKAKKRPSKSAKTAKKIVAESKLLAAGKVAREATAGQEFKSPEAAPKTSAAIKARPDKKRG